MASSPLKGYLCVVIAAIMWASSGVAGKALFNGGITPFELVQIRVTVSTLLLAIFFSLYSMNDVDNPQRIFYFSFHINPGA